MGAKEGRRGGKRTAWGQRTGDGASGRVVGGEGRVERGGWRKKQDWQGRAVGGKGREMRGDCVFSCNVSQFVTERLSQNLVLCILGDGQIHFVESPQFWFLGFFCGALFFVAGSLKC